MNIYKKKYLKYKTKYLELNGGSDNSIKKQQHHHCIELFHKYYNNLRQITYKKYIPSQYIK